MGNPELERYIPMKNYTARKALAAALCLSMLPAFSACKKNQTKKNASREIKETDPYYDSETVELSIPVDETKELQWIQVSDVEYADTEIRMPYYINYEIPQEAYADMNFDFSAYSYGGLAVFDLKGNLISNVKQGEGSIGSECNTIDNEGNHAAFSAELNTDPEKSVYKIVFTDDNGNTLKEVTLDNVWKSEIPSIRSMKFLSDGKIVMQGYESIVSSTPIEVFDPSGKHLFSISSMDRNMASGMFRQDGKYYVLTISQDAWLSGEFANDYEVNEIDFEKGILKPGIKAKGIVFAESVSAAEDGLYSSTMNGISKFDMKTGEMEEILTWNQTDVDHNLLNMIKSYPKNENEIHAIATSYMEKMPRYYLVNLFRAEKNPHAGKQILYVGGQGISPSFYDFMHDYNADPDNDFRIETIDYYYSELESGNAENVEAGLTDKVYLDLLSGEGPDILMNFAATDQFANEDLLVDLNSYIDGKNGLDRSKYFDNIFRSVERDGKLFSIPTAFGLEGYLVDADVIHAESTWTFDDLDREADALPGDKMLIPKISTQNLLKTFIGPNLSEYMDYTKKEVHFSSESMIHILEEVKKYGSTEDNIKPASMGRSIPGDDAFEEVPYMAGSEELEDGTTHLELLIYSGACAMAPVSVNNILDYHLYTTLVPGEGKLLGYPTAQGKGIIASPGLSLSIVASSESKDASWEVIRAFMEEEAQLNMAERDSCIPVLRSAFEKIANETKEKIDRVYQVYLESMGSFDYYGGVYFPAASDLVDEFREIIESVNYSFHQDPAVMDILQEETAGYFSGSRSAEDVLKNVDNRAKQIVQEH